MVQWCRGFIRLSMPCTLLPLSQFLVQSGVPYLPLENLFWFFSDSLTKSLRVKLHAFLVKIISDTLRRMLMPGRPKENSPASPAILCFDWTWFCCFLHSLLMNGSQTFHPSYLPLICQVVEILICNSSIDVKPNLILLCFWGRQYVIGWMLVELFPVSWVLNSKYIYHLNIFTNERHS